MGEKKRKVERLGQNGASTENKPVHEIRVANVRASFWDNGGWCSVTFSRLYLSEGEKKRWGSTSSFRQTDMGNLALVAYKAEQWMATRLEAEVSAPESEDVPGVVD